MTHGSTNSQGRQLAALSAPAVIFTVAMIAFPVVYTVWLGFHSFSATGGGIVFRACQLFEIGG